MFFPSFLILTLIYLPKACRCPPSLSLTLHPAVPFLASLSLQLSLTLHPELSPCRPTYISSLFFFLSFLSSQSSSPPLFSLTDLPHLTLSVAAGYPTCTASPSSIHPCFTLYLAAVHIATVTGGPTSLALPTGLPPATLKTLCEGVTVTKCVFACMRKTCKKKTSLSTTPDMCPVCKPVLSDVFVSYFPRM